MNKKALSIVTSMLAALIISAPAFADDAHHPAKAAVAKPAVTKPVAKVDGGVDTMADSVKMMDAMHEMHEKMMKAKTPEERSALMADHMKTMQDGMNMMGKMKEAEQMKGKMSGDMEKHHHMMEKRMDMMASMMQMMMDRMPATPTK